MTENKCMFDEAWRGKCNKPLPCKEHDNLKCWKCGEKATFNCSYAGQFVCGTPSCNEHDHYRYHN